MQKNPKVSALDIKVNNIVVFFMYSDFQKDFWQQLISPQCALIMTSVWKHFESCAQMLSTEGRILYDTKQASNLPTCCPGMTDLLQNDFKFFSLEDALLYDWEWQSTAAADS